MNVGGPDPREEEQEHVRVVVHGQQEQAHHVRRGLVETAAMTCAARGVKHKHGKDGT